jgi:DNA polymerase-3 subunit alpha
MIAVIDRVVERAQKLQRAREAGQHGLFGGGSAASTPMPAEELPEVAEWPEHELLGAEYATLGFYISGHPLDKYAGRLKDLNAIELSTLEGKRNGEDIVVAGIIVSSRGMRSRRGARWMIVTLQDRTGVIEALVFPEAFQKLEPILKAATPLLVKGRVAVEDVGTRLIVSDARVLDQVNDKPPSLLRVRVDLKALDAAVLNRLGELFTSRPGRCRV